MKIIQHVGAFLLCISVMLTMLPSVAFAETISGSDQGFTCEIIDGVAYVTGTTSTVGETVVIPSTLCGYPVVGIGSRAFWQCENLTSVTIPDSVKYIESEAFGYTSLRNVTLPDGVISIGYGAFWCCDDLRTISIPNSVKYIGSSAFQSCDELTGLTIPSSVEQIGSMILNGCDGIKYISIPFLGFDKEDAQTAKLGYLFSPIEDYEAVPGGLKRVELTNTEYVSDFAFAGCHYIQEILLPEGVKYIGEGAFSSCVAMETLVLPQSVTTIGTEAFKLCNFESINIPSNIKKIGAKAFYRCDELNEFYYCGTEAQWNAIEFGSDNDSLTSLERQGHKWGSWETDDEYIYRRCIFCNTESSPISQTEASFQYRSRSKKYLVSEEELSAPWILYDTKSGYKHTDMRTAIADWDDSEEMSAMYSACKHKEELVNKYVYNPYGTLMQGTYWYGTAEEFQDAKDGDWIHWVNDGGLHYRYTYCTSIEHYTDYYYYMWTDWTNWGDTVYTPDDDTEVEIREVYAITYDANGGVNAPNTQIKIADEECFLSSSIPQNDNLIFLGWATTPNGHVEYQPGDSYSLNATVTLYAIWAVGQAKTYTVTYNANAGSGAPSSQTKTHDVALTLSSTVPTRTGYTFKGWATSSTGSVAYASGASYTANANVTLYAVWENSQIASGTCGDNLTWNLDDAGTLTISGTGAMTDWSIYLDVPWYSYRNSIENVVISSGVTSIGNEAFYKYYLTSIEIPDSVISIGNEAFYTCYSLTSISFGENSKLTSIGNSAFNGCEKLTSIELPEGVTSIGNRAFYHCESLTSISYGENSQLASIGYMTFCDCSSLTSIEIPASVTSIGGYAFYGCYSLTSIEIPASVTSIGEYAFYWCDSLTSIEISASVTSIGDSAFAYCDNLTNVYYSGTEDEWNDISIDSCNWPLTNAVIHYNYGKPTYIVTYNANGGSGAPSSQTKTHDVALTLSSTVPTRSGYTFKGWATSSTGSVAYGSGASYTANANVTLYAVWQAKTYTVTYNANGGSGAPSSQTKTHDIALTLSSTVPTRTGYTFKGWATSSTGSVAYASGASYTSNANITLYAVWEKSFIASGTCGDNLTWTFDENGTLTISGTGAMTDWSSYSDVPWYSYNDFIENVVISSGVTSIGDYAFCHCINLTSIETPASVTSIGERVFYNCDSLTSISFGENSKLTSIGNYAFCDCSGLTSIEIPNSVRSIGDDAFSYCDSLASISFGENSKLTSIGEEAFEYCSSLTSIEIPASVTSIGEWAFYNCTGLTSIEIPASVTSIGNGAFCNCFGLTSIEIPDSITSICGHAFYSCSNLTSIELPASVTSIGNAAFFSCTNLTSIEIPASVTSIDNYAFYSCDSLTDVYYSGTEAEWNDISIGSSNEPLTNATINYNYKEEPEVIYGDITGDGDISVSDVIRILKFIAGATSLIDENGKRAADVDADGVISVSDAIRILKYIASPDNIILGPKGMLRFFKKYGEGTADVNSKWFESPLPELPELDW